MTTSLFQTFRRVSLALAASVALLLPGWSGGTPVDVSRPRATVPPNIVTTSNRPMVMLAVSKDHSLFGPVYTDFEDLDDDGIIDTTFKPSFKYYGYFDATKCYAYTGGQFEPAVLATAVTGATPAGATTITYKCPASQSYWSGNFLNWATMTRLDVVRKMLYGGNRSTDASANTVLQGTDLVFDAHSFVKYYRGSDIRDYTPFTTAALTKSTGPNAGVYAGLSICTTGTTDSTATTRPQMKMVKGNVRFWSTVEIQLCRWRDSPDFYSSTGTFGPKLAAYYQDADKGNGGVAHEITIPSRTADGATYGSLGPELNINVKVCVPSLLGEERCQPFPYNSTTNYKPYGLLQEFGYPATSGTAARAEFGLITGSYDLNHTAGALRKNMGDMTDEINPTTGVFCHNPLALCPAIAGRTIGNGAIKALDAILLFGRSPGSYGGGNTPSGSGEGNLPAWGNPIGEMLVQSLQFYASTTSSNPGSNSNDSNAGMQVVAWQDPLSNTNTTRTNLYGNAICRPLHTLALSPSALSFDGQAATPFGTLPNRSGSLDSYTDAIGVAEGLAGTLRSVGSVSGKGLTATDDTNSCSAKTIGSLSNVNGICPEAPAMGGTYQVAGAALYGNTTKIRNVANPPGDLATVPNALKVKTLAASLTGGSPRIDVPVPGTNKFVYITPESVQNGGKVSAPLTFASINAETRADGTSYGAFIVTWNDILLGGDYDMDITGFIRYETVRNGGNWDIKITTDIPGVCGGGAGTHGFSVIGVQDSTGANANGRYLTHQHLSTGKLTGMPGRDPATNNSQYLCGDDSYRARILPLAEQLADSSYGLRDQANQTYANTVCNVTGNGTTYDPTIRSLTSYCTVKPYAYPVTTTFRMVGETNALVKDPLWYAAKYGYFNSSVRNPDGSYTTIGMPTTQDTWDALKADGTSGSDGVPDGYFLARRPDVLEAQLRRALADIAGKANSAPSTSTAQLLSGTYRYDVTFNADTYDGNIEAYSVNAGGDFNSAPTWRAGTLLGCRTRGDCAGFTADGGNSRQIITNSGNAGGGVKFRWADLPADYQAQMTTASTNRLSTANATATVAYVRGAATNESASSLRVRGESNVLGAIVNSTPWVQDVPAAGYTGSGFAGYAEFVRANRSRSKLLWAGANDGMLHAFDYNTGSEVFGYVPGVLANRLAEIPLQRNGAVTTLNGSAFVTGAESRPDGTLWPYVDGSPFTADVRTGIDRDGTATASAWRTYLFGSLGRGGRAVFALDVTSPANLARGENMASSIFKWQFTADDDADLGYITNDFNVSASSRQAMPLAKMNNGKFAYVIGNGYKSPNGKAFVYVLFVDGPASNGSWTQGTQYIKLATNAETGNGMSQVTWIDTDGNGTADFLYAGDIQGNLWKFDVRSSTESSWGSAYKATALLNLPLITATDNSGTTRLPITTAPQYVYGPFAGPVIFFGTGNAFETGDYPTVTTQRVYAVRDNGNLPTAPTSLVARAFSRASDGTVTINGTPNDVNWITQNGWYATLPGVSEVMVADVSVSSSTFVFTSIRPPVVGSYCSTQPAATLYALDTLSGTAKRSVLGITSLTSGSTTTRNNNVGTAILDQKVKVIDDRTGKPYKPGDSTTQPTCGDGQAARRIVGPNTDKSICFNGSPRKQWREIPGLRTDK